MSANKNIPADVITTMNEAASISHYYGRFASDEEYEKDYPKKKAAFEKQHGKGSFSLYLDLYWDKENYETKYKAKIEALKKKEKKHNQQQIIR